MSMAREQFSRNRIDSPTGVDNRFSGSTGFEVAIHDAVNFRKPILSLLPSLQKDIVIKKQRTIFDHRDYLKDFI